MGLSNSAQCWQRLLTSVLSDMLFTSAIVYLDDVLLLSKDFEQHYSHLLMLCAKFRQARLRMNGKKCKFAMQKVKYLGHILSRDGISVDSAKTDIIMNWPQPKTVKRLNLFMGWLVITESLLNAIRKDLLPYENCLVRTNHFFGVTNNKNLSKI